MRIDQFAVAAILSDSLRVVRERPGDMAGLLSEVDYMSLKNRRLQ